MAETKPRRTGSHRSGGRLAELLEVLSSSADGVYAVDGQQRIVYWNDAAERLLGRTRDEVLGRPCYEVMLGLDYEEHPFCRANCPTIAAVRRGQAVPNYDLATTRPDGTQVWLNQSIIPFRDSGKSYAVHMFRDVSARRIAERIAQDTIRSVRALSDEERSLLLQGRPQPTPLPRLTPRELETLGLLGEGLGTQQMADRMGVSRITVRNHVERLLAKLGAHSRLEAVMLGQRLGLI